MIILKASIDDNRFVTIKSRGDNLDKIEKLFSFSDLSNCWVNGSFRREYIKIRKFLTRTSQDPTTGLLPIGFLGDLEAFLISNQAKYLIEDNRSKEIFSFTDKEIRDNLSYLTLYDYQIEAIKVCLKLGNGIVKSATGSGKTEMFISLCNLMKKKTLILFARIDLARQTLRRMIDAGVDAGIVQGGEVDEKHQVIMATVQSGHKLVNKYEMLIVDEVHRASGEQYQNIIMASMFRYRFGFSATPFVGKKDEFRDAKTKAWLGGIIYEVKSEKLIDEEKIADPIIHMVPIAKPIGIDNYKWMPAEKYGIVRNKYRNEVIAKLCQDLTGQILILVKKIDHGKTLASLIPNAIFLHGVTNVKERAEVVKRFDAGEEFVLIASTIFDEGIDLRSVAHLFIAGGGSSYIKVLQRIGRGMRVTATKKTVDVYDFFDKTNPILLKHSNERIKLYRKEGYNRIFFEEDMVISAA
jgi:superfamily II DNA or RNA helicase